MRPVAWQRNPVPEPMPNRKDRSAMARTPGAKVSHPVYLEILAKRPDTQIDKLVNACPT
jgi:hypothetical protein